MKKGIVSEAKRQFTINKDIKKGLPQIFTVSIFFV